MLKHNSKRLQVFKACSLILISIFPFIFSGCKSAPEEVKVNPLELIDSKSQIYFRIPTEVDQVLVKRMLVSNVQGLSEGDAQQVVDRTDTIYVGYTKKRKSTEYQIAARCNIPQIAINKVFNKKNGFTSSKVSYSNSVSGSSTYEIYSNDSLDISFPGGSTAALGRDVPSMVQHYHNLFQGIEGNFQSLPAEIFEFLNYDKSQDEAQVRFWATNPYSFLTLLTGAQLNLALKYVRGYMKNDPKNSRQYLMQFEFEFKDQRMVRAAQSALMLAFGLTDSNVYLESPTHLIISDIKISKEQLYNLFTL